jgi:hypothetical protein
MKCASWPRRADTATLGAARSGADEHRLEEPAIDPLDISKPNLAHKFGDPSRRNRQIAGRQDHRSSVGIVYRHDFKSQFIPSPAPCPHLTKAVSAPVPQPFTVWVCFNGPRRWWHTIIAHGDNVTTCWPCAAEALLECCPDLPLAFEMGSELSAPRHRHFVSVPRELGSQRRGSATIRTTNLLERLFLEERRRTKIIPHAFGERPMLKLMYAAVIRAAHGGAGSRSASSSSVSSAPSARN